MAQCVVCNQPVADTDRYCPTCGTAVVPPTATPTETVRTDLPPPATPPRSPTPEVGVAPRLLPGAMLAGRYRIIERIGHGGMGEVFRAEDLRIGQTVALKFIRHAQARSPGSLELFISEVRLARQIGHPNVCRVYDIGEADGVSFLSMEFVDGEDLASLLRRIRRLPPDKATEIAREICSGLAAIHDLDVLHRDLKPSNVMIDGRGRARITDFGLAALQSDPHDRQRVVGTPAYMAPEVREGGESTPRSDIYSLGLVLYETYTGGSPEEGAAVANKHAPHRIGGKASPQDRMRELDPEVARIIERCLDPDPTRRPGSAMDVSAALPGGDPIAAALAAGRTPEPELLAAAGARERAMRPAAGWVCMVGLVLGLAAVLTVAPQTRLVAAARMHEAPPALTTRARLMLSELGFPEPGDAAGGFVYDEATVARVAATDRSGDRWTRLLASGPPVLRFWHRESPRALEPFGPQQRVTPTDPVTTLPGMVDVELDPSGRLVRLESVALAGARGGVAPDWSALFKAAGLSLDAFTPAGPESLPATFADTRLAWVGPASAPAASRLRVEAAALGATPVLFAVSSAAAAPAVTAAPPKRPRDPVQRASAAVRAVLLLVAFLVAAWLARRNTRRGRGDRRAAMRVGAILMGGRLAVWILGGHHTLEALPLQFSVALAWSLYDFAFARVFYLAVEPYVRRLWPHVLVSWVRVLSGRHDDPLVGRDVLVGCLVSVALALLVAAHQAAPVLLGLPPGRPDNVGFVPDTLLGTMGLRHQLAQMLVLYRSAVVTSLGYVVVLVALRLLVRRSWIAFVLATLIFLSVAMPKGEVLALDVLLAASSTVLLLIVLMRVGLLATMVGFALYLTLQASVLGWHLFTWPGDTSWYAIALVLGLGGVGFVRALAGRVPVLREIE